MTALPPEEVDDLERENARLKAELRTARDHQNASAEILKVIASSPSDVQPVLEAVADRAMSLLDAWSVVVTRFDGELLHFGAARGALPDTEQYLRNTSPMRPEAGIFAGRCIQERASINISDAQADPNPLVRERARLRGLRAALSVPMLRDGQPIGAITVSRREAGAFKANEVGLLQTFADQAVIAIENARLFNETKEALARQTATSEILRVISQSPTDVKPVFDAIVLASVRLLGCDRAFFLRCDGDTYSREAIATPDGLLAERGSVRAPIDPTANFPSRAMVEKKTLHLPDWSLIELPEHERLIHEKHGVNSALYLPLLREGECIYLLVLGGKRPGMFGESEIALAESFRDQALIAIENTRLFNETQEALERQNASADILRTIARTPGDADRALEQIAETCARLFGAPSATIHIAEGDGWARTIRFGASSKRVGAGVPDSQLRIGGRNLPGTIVAENRQVHVPDIDNVDPAIADWPGLPYAREAGTRSMSGSPLRREGKAIGALIVYRDRLAPFTAEELVVQQTFADQAAIAIENARLFNETREALERQTATADILKVIASSPDDVQPVFEAIATNANRLVGGFSSTVFRFIDGIAHLKAFTPTTPDADEVLKATFPRPVTDFPPFQMAQAGEVAQVPDTEALADDILNIARARGFRSMLFAPLMHNGVSIGLIAVTRLQPGSFSDHHVQLLRTFADQAVIAIENARLFDEVQARTRDLSESLQQQTATADVLKVISRSAFDLQTVLDTLVESAARLCEADEGTIFQPKDGVYRLAACCGLSATKKEFLASYAFRPGKETTTGRVLLEGRTIHIEDTANDPDYRLNDPEPVRTRLGVPLLREGAPIGVFVLTRLERRPFSAKQIELVQTFADQAVIAIENVRLFDEVQARTRELSQSLNDLRTAQDRLVQTEKLASLGQLTAGIAHEIKNPLNFVNNFAALSAELTDELNDVLKPVTLAGKVREQVDELAGLLKDNLEKVVQHGKRADSIVKNMLLHSREGSGEHRPADINALLDESLNLAYHGARAEKPQFNVTLQRDFDDRAGMIELFPQEITRVFLNLISNGFYAVTKRRNENGGSGFEPVVSATTKDLGNTVEIRIRDNGTGIPAEVREKMFNPFFTTKPAGEGTGLGLSMSHDIIVKQHGGSIDVETEPGQFTEFRIILPRASNSSSKIRGQT